MQEKKQYPASKEEFMLVLNTPRKIFFLVVWAAIVTVLFIACFLGLVVADISITASATNDHGLAMEVVDTIKHFWMDIGILLPTYAASVFLLLCFRIRKNRNFN
jgi:hypothetical protein